MNAKYNALLLGREDYRVASDYILQNYDENYGEVLPIFMKIDSTKLDSAKYLLIDAVKKTSLVAERHSNSKHLDEAYLLLGKTRLAKQEILNSIETFKFVNTKSENPANKNEALVWLMRAYIENEDINTANQVADVLKTQALKKETKSQFLITMAYLHQKENELPLAAVFLEEGLKYKKKGEEKARLHFIVGQLYDKLNQPVLARKNYLKVLKNKPIYDLEFNANLGLIMNQSLAKNSNLQFEKMLEDRKNQDLKDKLYYKMGELETKKKNYQSAINYFTKSAQFAEKNLVQKAYAYKSIGDIYFDHLVNFETAAVYYDSTLITIPKDYAEYRNISQRALSLNDFIKYQKVLDLEDSLQTLAALNPLELDYRLEKIILDKKALEKKKENDAKNLLSNIKNTKTINSGKKLWILYDQVAMLTSKNEFIRVWGSRALEDNWRRADREVGGFSFKIETNVVDTSNGTKPVPIVKVDFEQEKKELDIEKAELQKRIPLTPIQLAASKRKQEEAYFQLGKIYKLRFQDEIKSKKSFTKLITDFPGGVYDPEALYFLAIMSPNAKESEYAITLKKKYPYSSFARLVDKGDVKLTASKENEALAAYSTVYKDFELGNYEKVLSQLDKNLNEYLGSQIEDKMAMLRILTLAKISTKEQYLISLTDFIRSYPTSDLISKARKLLKAMNI